MVTAKSGIFDSQSAGGERPGWAAERMRQLGAQSGAPGLAAQGSALQLMGRTASGQGPSVAQQQMQQAQNRNMAQSMALVGMGRGGNLAGAQQQALGAQAGLGAQSVRDLSLMRAQEQLAAQQAYAQQANAMAGQQMGYEQLAQQGVIAGGQQNIDWQLGKGALDLEREKFQNQQRMGWVNAGVGLVGAVGSFFGSDERLKTGIAPASAAGAAAEIAPVQYDYRPGAGPEGQQIGVSADQVAQTSLGPTLVRRGPDGMLQIDGARAGVAGLAAAGENTRRLEALEQRLGIADGNYGTAEAGALREREAERLRNEIAMQRGLAQVSRGEAAGVQPANFSGAPQMSRFHSGQTIDPFAEGFKHSGSRLVDRLRSEYGGGEINTDALARAFSGIANAVVGGDPNQSGADRIAANMDRRAAARPR